MTVDTSGMAINQKLSASDAGMSPPPGFNFYPLVEIHAWVWPSKDGKFHSPRNCRAWEIAPEVASVKARIDSANFDRSHSAGPSYQ